MVRIVSSLYVSHTHTQREDAVWVIYDRRTDTQTEKEQMELSLGQSLHWKTMLLGFTTTSFWFLESKLDSASICYALKLLKSARKMTGIISIVLKRSTSEIIWRTRKDSKNLLVLFIWLKKSGTKNSIGEKARKVKKYINILVFHWINFNACLESYEWFFNKFLSFETKLPVTVLGNVPLLDFHY